MPVCMHVHRIVHDNVCTVMTLINTVRNPLVASGPMVKYTLIAC